MHQLVARCASLLDQVEAAVLEAEARRGSTADAQKLGRMAGRMHDVVQRTLRKHARAAAAAAAAAPDAAAAGGGAAAG